MRVGVVAELWVYPVKSMRGVRVPNVALDSEGMCGDRRFAFESTNAPAGKPLLTGRERASMLLYAPTADGAIQVTTPEGNKFLLTDTALLGGSAADDFQLLHSPERPLTDVRPVSLVSTGTLQAISTEMNEPVDSQRFRSNIVLRLDSDEPFAEEGWSDRTLRFGEHEADAELWIRERIPRCRMVSLDPATAEPHHGILRHLAREHRGRLGMYATVQHPGPLHEGQPVFLL